MNTIRMIAIALPMMLLMACGGGGGSNTTAVAPTPIPPTPPPPTSDPNTPPTGSGEVINPLTGLANVNVESANSPTIQAVERITGATNARIFVSAAYQEGNLDKIDSACSATTCGITIPETIGDDPMGNSPQGNEILPFKITNPHLSLFLLNTTTSTIDEPNAVLNADSSIFMVTEGISVGDITFARGDATPDFVDPNFLHLEFRTFAGWIDESIFFGTTQIEIGETTPVYRFISHAAGVPTGSDPSSTGSATWEGAVVASIKADRTFILGDAEITVNFMDSNVDLMFDDWRGLDNQAVSGMSAITYNDLALSSGSFTGSGNEQVQGRFYGTAHTEVGGFFNTETVTGAFGGTRQ